MNTREDQLASAIEHFLRLVYRPGDVFEVRVPKCRHRPDSTYATTASGYFTFDAIADAARQIADLDRSGLAPGLYITLNPVRPDLLARAANRIDPKASVTTADHDVPRRRRLLIDADALRPSGTSSTDAELAAAEAVIRRIITELGVAGWPDPVLGMSGNGWHAIYAIDLPAEDDGLVERILRGLAARYDTEVVKIDTVVYNAARITKVLGTVARKGDDLRGIDGIDDRPHRRSRIVEAPAELAPVPHELLESVAALAPAPVPPSRKPGKRGDRHRGVHHRFERFEHSPEDVKEYLERHGAAVKAVVPKDGSTLLHLERCPVLDDCPSTGGSDISVIVMEGGGIAYKNLHERGKDVSWIDVREAFEPGYRDHHERAQERGEDDGATQRDRIVQLAVALYRFGRTPSGEAFAVLHEGPNIALMLRSGQGSLRAQLALQYVQTSDAAPNSSSLADAMLVLEGVAMTAEPEPVHLRLARHEGSIVIDVGDASGWAVVVDAAGWRVAERSPVLFRRSPLTGALSTPRVGGDVRALRPFLNISEAAWPLALGWLVAAMLPGIEHPIVLLGGQQDSGKSTTAKFLSATIDPSPVALRAPPKDVEQWAVSASASWIVVIDNVSVIPEWLSDALCRAVTGDGLVRRLLYSSEGLSVLAFQRCVILTSIDPGALKGDLGRRLLLLDLEPVDRKRKRRASILSSEFEAARPLILGGLLDLLVKVLRALPGIELEQFEGLADFEHVLAAVDHVLGTQALPAYRAQWSRIAADVVEGDAVAVAVVGFAERSCRAAPWVGTAGELLDELRRLVPSPLPKGFPTEPRGLGGELRRLVPVLRAVGVEVRPPQVTDKRRRFEVRLTAPTAQQPERGPGGSASGDSPEGDGRAAPPVDGIDGPSNGPADSPAPNPPCRGASGEVGPSGDQGGRSGAP